MLAVRSKDVGRAQGPTLSPDTYQHTHVPHPHCQVNQGNMPGVQSTFLAMDTEEGVEVVWNELHFGDRKAFAAHEVRPAHSLSDRAPPPHPVTAPPFPGEDPDHV